MGPTNSSSSFVGPWPPRRCSRLPPAAFLTEQPLGCGRHSSSRCHISSAEQEKTARLAGTATTASESVEQQIELALSLSSSAPSVHSCRPRLVVLLLVPICDAEEHGSAHPPSSPRTKAQTRPGRSLLHSPAFGSVAAQPQRGVAHGRK